MRVSERHFGMDLVRAGAIVTVLIGHGLAFFHPHYPVLPLVFLAVFGVELFFALSGFLIGRILLEVADESLELRKLRIFWLKRWFRTIPAYLAVVMLTIVATREVNWSQFLFVQNFFPRQLENFATSWSLTIEEWFYLLFPLLMLVLARFRSLRSKPALLVLTAACIFILGSWYLRFNAASGAAVPWDLGIRKQIPMRLDAIAFGVVLAVWHQRRPEALGRSAISNAMALTGVLGFLACWWYFQNHVDIFSGLATTANAALFYPAISVACTALTGALIRYPKSPGGRMARLIYLTSLTSYSLYLLHLQIFAYLSPRAESPGTAWLWFAVALAAMVLAGALLYVLVEKPFMQLRRRFDPADTVSTHLQPQ